MHKVQYKITIHNNMMKNIGRGNTHNWMGCGYDHNGTIQWQQQQCWEGKGGNITM